MNTTFCEDIVCRQETAIDGDSPRYYDMSRWNIPSDEEVYYFLKTLLGTNTLGEISNLSGKRILDISANSAEYMFQLLQKIESEVREYTIIQPDINFSTVEIIINDAAYIDQVFLLTTLGKYVHARRQEILEKLCTHFVGMPQITSFYAHTLTPGSFQNKKFDVIIDRLGALWSAANNDRNDTTIPRTKSLLATYNALLASDGYLIIDGYRKLHIQDLPDDLYPPYSTRSIILRSSGNLGNAEEFEQEFYGALGFIPRVYEPSGPGYIVSSIMQLRKVYGS